MFAAYIVLVFSYSRINLCFCPDQDSITDVILLESSQLIIQNNNGNILMKSGETLSMNCTNESNPPATCTWIGLPDVDQCQFSKVLQQSTTLQCQAKNVEYTNVVFSNVINVTVIVNEERKLII